MWENSGRQQLQPKLFKCLAKARERKLIAMEKNQRSHIFYPILFACHYFQKFKIHATSPTCSTSTKSRNPDHPPPTQRKKNQFPWKIYAKQKTSPWNRFPWMQSSTTKKNQTQDGYLTRIYKKLCSVPIGLIDSAVQWILFVNIYLSSKKCFDSCNLSILRLVD